ncbi:T9SS type A sorting domain-containing protein [Cellulophaga sp. L1A9]|uniref:T9SS type A sorting domain-containing protein n=1 Tax=Cellulophaga sp. L1A9 TaxID=2686362 RepID=UPI00131B2658|nr:T9SS type A sorting domain-containing protein [Cellulophaga sp. L1A9]
MKKYISIIALILLMTVSYAQEHQNVKTIKIASDQMEWTYSGAGNDITLTFPVELSKSHTILSAIFHVSETDIREIPSKVVLNVSGEEVEWNTSPWNSYGKSKLKDSPELGNILTEVITTGKNWSDGDKIKFVFSGFEPKPLTKASFVSEDESYMEIFYMEEESVTSTNSNISLVIYPNPTFENFTASLKNEEGISSWKVVGLSGEQYITENNAEHSNEVSVDVNSLLSGVYVFQLHDTKGGAHSIKFIKK